jgi:hypothetical protein
LAKYERAVARGVDEAAIIAGAGRYAAFAVADGSAGTKFVQQATTWLNQEGWANEYTASRKTGDFANAFDNLSRRFEGGLEGSDEEDDGGGQAGPSNGFDFGD